jgi:hypothetical protein
MPGQNGNRQYNQNQFATQQIASSINPKRCVYRALTTFN